MQKTTLLVIAFFLVQKCFSQQTMPRDASWEIGLNITQTLAGFFNSGGQNITTDPYLLSFKRIKNNRGFRTAINFGVKRKDEFQNFGLRQIRETSADFRAGFERRYPLGQRFDFFWALDGVFRWNQEKVDFNSLGDNLVFEDQSAGIGAGPAFGVLFHINKHISLSTEGSLYAVYSKGKKVTQIDFSQAPQTDEYEQWEWLPAAPTSLYVIVRF